MNQYLLKETVNDNNIIFSCTDDMLMRNMIDFADMWEVSMDSLILYEIKELDFTYQVTVKPYPEGTKFE